MLLQFLHPGSHVERLDRREREAALLAPGEEPTAGTSVGTARVVVGDIGGKKFDAAPAGLVAQGGDHRRRYIVPDGTVPYGGKPSLRATLIDPGLAGSMSAMTRRR